MTWHDDGLIRTADRIEPPTVDPLDLAEVRDDHLRAPMVEVENRYIQRLIKAATRAAERDTRRSLMTQTWQLSLNRFPAWGLPIELDYPPVQAVESLEYLDDSGVTQTLDTSNYSLTVTGRDRNEKGRIELAYGASWPSSRLGQGSVTVTYRCGYVDGSSPAEAEVPEDILQGMLLLIGELYKQRSESVQSPNNTHAVIRARQFFASCRVY